MKILFSTLSREGAYRSWVTPGILEPHSVKYLPLGLLSLATNLQGCGHDIEIIDPFSNDWNIERTVQEINSRKADVIGFSAATRWSYSLYKMLPAVNAKWKIVGGPHCTYHADELLEWGADAVFRGPLADNELKLWLMSPCAGVFQCNTDITSIEYPDRTLLPYQEYFFEGKVLFEAKKRMSMFTSVGCPNGCRFCSVQSKKIRFKRPLQIAQEMLYLQWLGAQSLHIFDDNFNVNRFHVNEVLGAMEGYSIKTSWSMRGQVKCDLSQVPKMQRLGLQRVHVGIESLENESLKWMRKNHRFSDIRSFCQMMKDNGIEVLGYFIMGLPTETEEYLGSFVEQVKELGISKPYINILFPEPDTEYGQERLAKFWEEYFAHPGPDKEVPCPPEMLVKIDRAEKLMQELSKAF